MSAEHSDHPEYECYAVRHPHIDRIISAAFWVAGLVFAVVMIAMAKL